MMAASVSASAARWGQTTPNRIDFLAAAVTSRSVPIVRRLLAEDLTPTGAYRAFSSDAGTFILESAEKGEWGRWSFVGVNCPAHLIADGTTAAWHGRVPEGLTGRGDPLVLISEAVRELSHGPQPEDYPPFTGGLVGALGWEVVRLIEDLPPRTDKDIAVPDVALALATDLLAFDHTKGEVWLIACAVNFDGKSDGANNAYEDAVARLDAMEVTLQRAGGVGTRIESNAGDCEPGFNMEPSRFLAMVDRAQEAIIDGEVFQIVLSQRAELACEADPLDVYRVLRATNPSPYMYILALPTGRDGEFFHIVGSSPETLVEVRGCDVKTFPIAGSRPRGRTPVEDRALQEDLLSDPKEIAEHVMLVDLARNDLSKVCVAGSVRVEDYMAVRRYSHIMHITTTVTGQLRAGKSALDALRSAFPAGTLSGAPKVRAMELIDELEPTRRGLYGGVVGYLDLQGNMDMAIAIRTAVIARGRAYVQSGAGIVADSHSHAELEESRNKAAAALRAVQRANRLIVRAEES